MENISEYTDEISRIKSWFNWYDTQVMQYQRDMRLYEQSSINIVELDNIATSNAKRIKELEQIIKNCFDNNT